MMSRSSSDSATTRFGNSGYQSSGLRFEVNGFFYGVLGALALRADFGLARTKQASTISSPQLFDAQSILGIGLRWTKDLLDARSARRAERWLYSLDDDNLLENALRLNAHITARADIDDKAKRPCKAGSSPRWPWSGTSTPTKDSRDAPWSPSSASTTRYPSTCQNPSPTGERRRPATRPVQPPQAPTTDANKSTEPLAFLSPNPPTGLIVDHACGELILAWG